MIENTLWMTYLNIFLSNLEAGRGRRKNVELYRKVDRRNYSDIR